jgi:hypothetical protein
MRFPAFLPLSPHFSPHSGPDHLARTWSNANASPLTDSTPEAERLSPPAHLKAEAYETVGTNTI